MFNGLFCKHSYKEIDRIYRPSVGKITWEHGNIQMENAAIKLVTPIVTIIYSCQKCGKLNKIIVEGIEKENQ